MRMLGIWERLRTSFWFLPSVMAAAAVALSFALIRVDTSLASDNLRGLGWLYQFGPEGARAVLSAIASSMMTVAGLTFSITMLTLQLASSQFGPRLLRSFMRDRGNQMVLGTFTSTFLYCLFVLRTVRGTEGASFVPHLSVALGVLLAVLSLAVLIYFIHHVAVSIRIETVLAELATETRAAIDRLYPEQVGHEPARNKATPSIPFLVKEFDLDAHSIGLHDSGYVQRIDDEALMRIATDSDLVIRINARPGTFVTDGFPVLSVVSREPISDEMTTSLGGALVIGPDRTPAQDLEFSMRRIVEIAQRALSPGINDPTTALYCIDRLGEALTHLAHRQTPSPVRVDADGRPRVVTSATTLEELACPALAAVARYGARDLDVIRRLLDVIASLVATAGPGPKLILSELGASILEASQAQLTAFDRKSLAEHMRRWHPERMSSA